MLVLHERHDDDRDERGRHRDEQDLAEREVVRRDCDQPDQGRHRRRDRATGDAVDVGNGRGRERTLGTDVVVVRGLVDDREQRIEDVRRARGHREDEAHERRDVVQLLRVLLDDLGGDLHEEVDASGRLHRAGRGDHRDDDEHRRAGRRTGRHPEDEHEDADARDTPEAQADAAHADTQDDGAQDHENLEQDSHVHCSTPPSNPLTTSCARTRSDLPPQRARSHPARLPTSVYRESDHAVSSDWVICSPFRYPSTHRPYEARPQRGDGSVAEGVQWVCSR